MNKPKQKKPTRIGRGVGALRMIQAIFPQVKEVRDATKAVLITVTDEDADGAKPKDPRQCALARACNRDGLADGALIGLGISWLIKGTIATRYKTSGGVGREIVSFDRHHDFAAGKDYRLSPISPANRMGIQRGESGSGNGHGKPPRVAMHRTVRVREAAVKA